MGSNGSEVTQTKDRNGRPVRVGTRVRLVVPLPSFVGEIPQMSERTF